MQPLLHRKFKLEKFEGKGGWTYIRIPAIRKSKTGKALKIRVKGRIDSFEISQYVLMPMQGGKLLMAVRAEIRKAIQKDAGDTVEVILFEDQSEVEVPKELMLCLKDEPPALHFFLSLSQSEKRLYSLWINSAKTEKTKANRIAKSIDRLVQRKKLYQPD